MQITAEVKLDSVSPEGIRLTTMEVTYPRFIHAEFMTHRVFSRNSASSRAIPVKKQLEKIKNDPAMPIRFGTNQPGMQAGPPLVDYAEYLAYEDWRDAADSAATHAEYLQRHNIHKEVTNRILEPFMWHTVIVTAVDFENFFNQRCSPLAQPEIEALANAMREAYNYTRPTVLHHGGWHMPYLQEDELDLALEVRIRISAARCARVSYLTQNGVRDYSEDLNLFSRLVDADPPHYSPLEHVATPFVEGLNPGGNFVEFMPVSADRDDNILYRPKGWAQLRHNMETLYAMV